VSDIRRSVTDYLNHIDAPVETHEDLVTQYLDRDVNLFLQHEFPTPDTNWFLRPTMLIP